MDCFAEYFKSQERTIRQHLLLASSFFVRENIHELRVEIKRFRAFLHLVAFINPVFRPEQDLRIIRKLFKSSGKIRDIHVQQSLVRDYAAALHLELSEYLNVLKEMEWNARKQFAKAGKNFECGIFKKIQAELRNVLIYLSGEYIQYKSEERLKSLFQELFVYKDHTALQQKEYHAIRILLKETRYTLEILQKCFPEKSPSQDVNAALREMHRALGTWHDCDIGLEFIALFEKDFGTEAYFDKESYSVFKQKIEEERINKLQEFHNKWTVFLGEAQEVEC